MRESCMSGSVRGALSNERPYRDQSVAVFVDRNHIFEKTQFSACGEAEMGLAKSGDVAARFSAYVEGLTSVIGHQRRQRVHRLAEIDRLGRQHHLECKSMHLT